jgi:hypothetical protein
MFDAEICFRNRMFRSSHGSEERFRNRLWDLSYMSLSLEYGSLGGWVCEPWSALLVHCLGLIAFIGLRR